MDIYMKDDMSHGMELKNANDLTCFIYMTKTNRTQHLNTATGKYIFLKRPEGERSLVWTILLMFAPIPETRCFFYIRTDSLAACLYHLIIHKERTSEQGLQLQYYINTPFYLRVTVELFLFAKTLKPHSANEVLLMMNDHVDCGSRSELMKQPINELFNFTSIINVDNVCKFESYIKECLIVESVRFQRKTDITFTRQKAWKTLMMQTLSQTKFSTSYQPSVGEMMNDCITNMQIAREYNTTMDAVHQAEQYVNPKAIPNNNFQASQVKLNKLLNQSKRKAISTSTETTKRIPCLP